MPIPLPKPSPPPDLAAEVAALGDADLLRLRAIARLRARGLPGVDERDLFNEAVLRLLDGAALRAPVAGVATDIIRGDRAGVPSYLLHCERSSGRYLFGALVSAGEPLGIGVDGFRLPGI